MRRALAVVAALAMVVGAVLLRGHLDSSGNDSSADHAAAPAVLVCSSELAAVCEQLQHDQKDLVVRIEEAPATEAALVAAAGTAEVDFDAWLTVAPFPQLVREQRDRATRPALLGDDPAPIARSPLGLAIWDDRAQVLTGRCGGTLTWRCIGEVAGTPWSSLGAPEVWGPVKPGQPDPARTATGLLVLGQASASFFGRSDYAANDFTDPTFAAWFERLERAVPSYPVPPRTPVDDMLSLGPATFDVAGALEAAAGPAIARSRDNDRLHILYPAPVSTADVVLVPVLGAPGGDRLQRLAASPETAGVLATNGWRVDGHSLATGLDANLAMPPDDGLPKAGVLQALSSLWQQVVR